MRRDVKGKRSHLAQPFFRCISHPDLEGGACGNCVWTEETGCSYISVASRLRKEKEKKKKVDKSVPRRGPKAWFYHPPPAHRLKLTELTAPIRERISAPSEEGWNRLAEGQRAAYRRLCRAEEVDVSSTTGGSASDGPGPSSARSARGSSAQGKGKGKVIEIEESEVENEESDDDDELRLESVLDSDLESDFGE